MKLDRCSTHFCIVFVGVITIGFLASACGGSSPTSPTSTATPTPAAANYEGSWSGSTNQSQPVAFTIANRQVTAFTMGVTTRGSGYSCTETLTLSSPVSITSNRVTVRGRTPSYSDLAVDITFGSDRAATGVLGDIRSFSPFSFGCVSSGTYVYGSPQSMGGPWTFSASRL